MSYYVGVRIYCDAEDCQEVYEIGYRNRGGMTKTWAGYMARREGWFVQGTTGNTDPKVAYCPTHHPKREKTT